ncbi:molybdopterin dinucleotide binding domain-containing protein, partial [Sutterella sp.]|uniref:molybdopterin dinucleotide binding domain-containing protein n=1 Tax=Sutterella sp. TaxID=1981025 RepID=UPI0026E0B22C
QEFVAQMPLGCALGGFQVSNAGLEPPEGCEAREEIWQFCEILRRAFPERAKERLGYDHEMKTREEFHAWYRGMMDAAWEKFIAQKNKANPGDGDRIREDVLARGWSRTATKKFGVYPWKKPFGTPTGKPEIISFLFASKYEKKGASGVCDWETPPGYTLPRPRSNEFYLVTGKDSASCSGVALFTWPTKFLGDRTLWMNPVDAERLGIRTGDMVELTAIDTGVKGRSRVTVTNRVIAGSLFAHGFSGGVRTKRDLGAYEWTREGVNSHWFATGRREPVTGSLSNNSSVRVERIGA